MGIENASVSDKHRSLDHKGHFFCRTRRLGGLISTLIREMMSGNKDTLAAGPPADSHSPPYPINGHIFVTCGHSFNSGKGKGSEIFVQKPVDKNSEPIREI